MDKCNSCGFELWHSYGELSVSQAGLYLDARFPGRTILSLREHYDQLDEVPAPLAADFMRDIQKLSKILKLTLNSPRINVSILGNTESHVHAHLIPRYPTLEALPHKSPWDDPRAREPLAPELEGEILSKLQENFKPKLM